MNTQAAAMSPPSAPPPPKAPPPPSSGRFAARLHRSKRAPSMQTERRDQATRQDKKAPKKKPKEKGSKGPQVRCRWDDPLNSIERQMLAFAPLPKSQAAAGQSAGSALTTGPTAGLSAARLQEIVAQVQMGVNEKGASMFQLELKGDALDGLKVQVSADKGQISVRFLSESPEIRKLLDENARTLEQSMRERGLSLASLETKDPKEQQREQQREQQKRERELMEESHYAV